MDVLSGHCTDYSISGNLIKQNWGTNCEVFETKPCPNVYRSTEAYKCRLLFLWVFFIRKKTNIFLTYF